MSISWAEVEQQLGAIQRALSSETPDVNLANRILAPLIRQVCTKTAEVAKPDRSFGEDELVKAAKHLAFETWMFRCLTRIRQGGLPLPASTGRQVLGYALLIRVLTNFFFNRSSSIDDCHAYHFNPITGFESVLPSSLCVRTPEIDKLSSALNKLLAHFTSTRWEQDRPHWNFYNAFTPKLETLISTFEGALTDRIRASYEEGYSIWQQSCPVSLADRSVEPAIKP